jgi:3-phosphoshikimate 1-carboxyvinyltransferase
MDYQISFDKKSISGDITLAASKSIHNRVLVIQHLCKDFFKIKNPASASDTSKLVELFDLLDKELKNEPVKNTYTLNTADAGTCFRFLTSYITLFLSDTKKYPDLKIVLTGSERMLQRPIRPLVEALRQLGASIRYSEIQGFPPLEISSASLSSDFVEIEGNISSQFITSLLLIAPSLPNGLNLCVKNTLTSKPYVEMTLSMMRKFGIHYKQEENVFSIPPQTYSTNNLGKITSIPSFFIEGDWSAASYWYSVVALSDSAQIKLRGLKYESIQGDHIISEIMLQFGVNTEFTYDGIIIRKFPETLPTDFSFDFSNNPDLAQTIIVLCSALGIKGNFTGLHTLRNKETDRIVAIKTEMKKLGVEMIESMDSLSIIQSDTQAANKEITFKTYNDHRMAMSLAPLVFKYGHLIIENIEVVNKSYPEFWVDLQSLGVGLKEPN